MVEIVIKRGTNKYVPGRGLVSRIRQRLRLRLLNFFGSLFFSSFFLSLSLYIFFSLSHSLSLSIFLSRSHFFLLSSSLSICTSWTVTPGYKYKVFLLWQMMSDPNLSNLDYRSEEVPLANARTSGVFWRNSKARDHRLFFGTTKKTLQGQGLESAFVPGTSYHVGEGEQDPLQWPPDPPNRSRLTAS